MRIRMLSTSFLFLLFFSSSVLAINFKFVSAQCLQDQKQLLLELRSKLTYDAAYSTKLVQWNESTDCCQWGGVRCDSKGRVLSLDLSSESISGGVNDSTSSLFRLLHLQSLSLADNGFGGSVELPFGFGKLTELRYLNLSSSDFSGQVPLDFSNLTRLVVLDLSSRYSFLRLESPDLGGLIHGFRMLRELYLDAMNVSGNGYDWCNAISSSLPDLRVLSMPNAYLTGPFCSSLAKLQSLSVIRLDGNDFSSPIPEFFADFPNLTVLTLSSCNLLGVTPERLFQIKSLRIIDLSNNRELKGSFPEFPFNVSLENLLLSYTQFSGIVPESIGRLKMLSSFDLGNSNFSGLVPRSIKNLSRLIYFDLSTNLFNGSVPSFNSLKNLEAINLGANSLTGRITDSIYEGLDSLKFLDLSDNSLDGEIPTTLFSLPSLVVLYLSNNQFYGSIRSLTNSSSSPLAVIQLSVNSLEGPIPRFLFELQNLTSLSLASNKFTGSVELTDFRKAADLASLDLSYNNLTVHVSENVPISSFFPRLSRLSLVSCKIQKLPLLRNQTSLMMLDLSDNQIHGVIPKWLWEVGNGFLRSLNLSHNQLTGLQEPYNWRSLQILDLHSNMLSGSLPTPPPIVVVVDFSSNNFSSFRTDIGNFLVNAFYFSIANNKIIGTIPPSLCNATRLQVLDFSNNSLRGGLPSCVLRKTLRVLNLRRNNLSSVIPNTFPIGCGLETLDLSWNTLQGPVPRSLDRCTELEVLNLGNNELSGDFPCWLKNLTKLRVLVLRSNKFHGNTSCLSYNWPSLQIIDLSSNNFSGVIPANLIHNLKGIVVNRNQLDHLHFDSTATRDVFYQDSVTITVKGQDLGLQKILTVFTSLDFSNNHFQGIIPEAIGELKSLYVLNISHNAISGHIPSSIGDLQALESLDLSFNNLGGEIPIKLSSLTFLSYLNLSNNQLVGSIPLGSQTMTFHESSFLGNEGLCGFPLNKPCSTDVNVPASVQ